MYKSKFCLKQKKATGTRWRGGWLDPSAGLDDTEKLKLLTLPGLEHQFFCRSTSMYRTTKYSGNLNIAANDNTANNRKTKKRPEKADDNISFIFFDKGLTWILKRSF
jgi:hypothetical protein